MMAATIIQTFVDSDDCGVVTIALVVITVFTPVQALIILGKFIDDQGTIVYNTPSEMKDTAVSQSLPILKKYLDFFIMFILFVKPFEGV